MPDLHVSLRRRAGPLDLDVQFTLGAAWTALFAPSGAGKTTILRMIAGLDRPDAGRILYQDADAPGITLLDTAAGVFVEPHLRHIRLVAQKPALFPHLSVLDNILYGMSARLRRDDAAERKRHLDAILKLCRVEHLRIKTPAQLSGGERQRVALARAIAVADTRLLLLDEPFTGLQADLRDELIQDLRAWTSHCAIPVLLVTHDLGEVFAARAHVLKMEAGRLVASGPCAEVLGGERNRLIERLAT